MHLDKQSYARAGHITCQSRNPYCQIIDDHRITGQERQEILHAHNRIRRRAARGLMKKFGLPAAANMKKLEWDDDLANNAQAHAEVTCQLKHDHPDQRSTRLYPEVGQNIYITEVWNQKLRPDTWAVVVENLWGVDEAAKLRANTFGQRLTLRGHDLKIIGHLTQLLWADTEKVGCGKIVFEGTNGATSDLRTCDYGEGGNVIGGEMYAEGPACSACPSSHPYCDDGLCSRTPVYGATHYYKHASNVQPASQLSYTPSYGNTAYVKQPAIPFQATSFWWNPPATRTYRTGHLAENFQYKPLAQSTYYHPASYSSVGQYNPYAQHQRRQQPVNQQTYNYQDYTILRRRRRSTTLTEDGRRRTRIL
ncbi:hypothetical protein BIW11_14353 [Tropilaelaps mercedesae]|uniref:SCP domain-containing protein n=1 Tax=Tropilaelaps mercedesae TaxID=418985 RepID=A0A1V9WYA8_9ACAR|nr:hypothetical protein BIW11_14353 [Tropilaelaps mercedesae]